MADRTLTIDGNVITEDEIRDILRAELVSQGCMGVEAYRLAANLTDRMFATWGEDDRG